MTRLLRRALIATTVGVLAISSFAATASASPPLFHEVKVPYSATLTAPAGTLCDFDYQQTFSLTDTFTVLSNFQVEVLEAGTDVNTNLDTGASLSESISYHYTFYPDGGWTQVGVFWQLRDTDGKLVVMHAGDVVFDAGYNVVKVTPDASTDFAAVICPALGGNPA